MNTNGKNISKLPVDLLARVIELLNNINQKNGDTRSIRRLRAASFLSGSERLGLFYIGTEKRSE